MIGVMYFKLADVAIRIKIYSEYKHCTGIDFCLVPVSEELRL